MARISLQQFYNETNGKSMPKFAFAAHSAGSYTGQCVSLISQYLNRCFDMSPGAWGDAVHYWTRPNAAVLKQFDKVSTTAFKDGDILVWGDDAGNWTGVYGHIGIWFKGQVYDQNFAGRMTAGLHGMFYQGFLGVLRAKSITKAPVTGGGKTVNESDLDALYKMGPLSLGGYQSRGRKSKEGSDVYLGKSATFVITDFFNSKEAKDKRAAEKKKLTDLAAARDAKTKDLAAEKSKSVGLVKNLDAQVKALKNAQDEAVTVKEQLNTALDRIVELESVKPEPTSPVEDSTPSPIDSQSSLNKLFEAIAAWFVSHTKKN